MITGNTHFTIAIHVLTALCFHERPVTSEMLAASVKTNSAFLRSILSRLREAGLIQTKLGKGGGSLLGRKPDEITLLDVYRATEGKAKLQSHTCEGVGCFVADKIPRVLGQLSKDLDQAMAAVLSQKTLADVSSEIAPPSTTCDQVT